MKEVEKIPADHARLGSRTKAVITLTTGLAPPPGRAPLELLVRQILRTESGDEEAVRQQLEEALFLTDTDLRMRGCQWQYTDLDYVEDGKLMAQGGDPKDTKLQVMQREALKAAEHEINAGHNSVRLDYVWL